MDPTRRFSLDPSWRQASLQDLRTQGDETLDKRMEGLAIKQKAESHPGDLKRRTLSREGSFFTIISPRTPRKDSTPESSQAATTPPRRGKEPPTPVLSMEDHIARVQDILKGAKKWSPGIQQLLEGYSGLITSNKKPLESAAEDLWRTCSKTELKVQKGEKVETPLEVDPKAYDYSIPANAADQKMRFLLLLSYFKDSFDLPEDVDWTDQVHAANAVGSWKLDPTHRLARFLRTCDQQRYHAPMLTSTYGLVPDDQKNIPPILALINQKEMYFTRSICENGTHSETITIPIDIFDRGSRSLKIKLNWILTFVYDADCNLKEIIPLVAKK